MTFVRQMKLFTDGMFCSVGHLSMPLSDVPRIDCFMGHRYHKSALLPVSRGWCAIKRCFLGTSHPDLGDMTSGSVPQLMNM